MLKNTIIVSCLFFLLSCTASKEEDLFNGAYEGNLDKVKSAIEKGVDINIVREKVFGFDGKSREPEIMRFGSSKTHGRSHEMNLVASGTGSTALFVAAENGHLMIVKYLIEKGADTNLKDSMGRTPLFAAVKESHNEVAKYLIPYSNNLDQRALGIPLLNIAVTSNNKELVNELLLKGASPVDPTNIRESMNQLRGECTSLYYTVSMDNFEMFKLLIDKGADINYACGSDSLIVTSIKQRFKLKYIKYLIQKGAELNKAGFSVPGGRGFVSNSFLGNYTFDIAKKEQYQEVLDLFPGLSTENLCKKESLSKYIYKLHSKNKRSAPFHRINFYKRQLGCSEKQICRSYLGLKELDKDMKWHCYKIKKGV